MLIRKYSDSGRALRMIQIWLKTWKFQITERLARITKIGFRIGSVMSRKMRKPPAPSIDAASTRSADTCVSPAKRVIVTKGIAPQTMIAVITAHPSHGFTNQSWRSKYSRPGRGRGPFWTAESEWNLHPQKFN